MSTLRNLAIIVVALLATRAGADTGVQPPVPEPEVSASGPVATETTPPPSLSAAIVVANDVTGEVLVLDPEGRLVTRVFKTEGHPFVLHIEPGRYTVEWRTEPSPLSTEVEVGDGDEIVVDRERLTNEDCCRPGPTRAAATAPRTWRLTGDMGMWSSSVSKLPTVTVTDDTLVSEGGGFLGGVSLGYRATPEWMVSLSMESRLLEAVDHDHHGDWDGSWTGDYERVATLASFTVGARYYLPPMASRSPVKPYVSAGIGPTLALDVQDRSHRERWHDGPWHGDDVRTMTAFGGYAGVGVDLQAASWLVMGADVAYHVTSHFSEPLAGHKNGTGLTFAFQLGVNLGRRLHAE